MCSIIGSFNLNKLMALIELNQFRGNYSYSLTTFNFKYGVVKDMFKDFGSFDPRITLNLDTENSYFIAHVQAPTGGLVKDINRVHPSISKDQYPKTLLWHNGIIKPECIKEIQAKYNIADEWDTKLLHRVIDEEGVPGLSSVDGSFGCIWICEPVVYIFTNDIVQLFIDDDLNLSSVEFEGSRRVKPKIGFLVDFENKSIDEIDSFESKSSPYYIP